MNIKHALLGSIILLASQAASASYLSPYLSFRGGLSTEWVYNVTFQNPRRPNLVYENNTSTPALFALAIGSRLNTWPFRFELQGAGNSGGHFSRDYFFPLFFSVVGIQKLKVQSYSLLFRSYYDFPLQWITPYISLGVGTAWNQMSATQIAPQLPGWLYNFVGTTKNNFAWSAGIGINKVIRNNWIFELGLNYVALGCFDTGVLPKTGDEHIFGKIHSLDWFAGLSYLWNA